MNALQYVLVGLALVLFYTLLLSFSEHIGFNAAYLVAALMTVLMEFFYARSVLRQYKTCRVCRGHVDPIIQFYLYSYPIKRLCLARRKLGIVCDTCRNHVYFPADTMGGGITKKAPSNARGFLYYLQGI